MRATSVRAVMPVWLNVSKRSQVGVGMNKSARGEIERALMDWISGSYRAI